MNLESPPKLLAAIECLLFVAGDQGIELAKLAKITMQSPAILKQALYDLEVKYQEDPFSALMLRSFGQRFYLLTKSQYAELIKSYANQTDNFLSKAALETLAIIAYRGPIARSQIDEIRGVNSSRLIQKLLELRLIKDEGRLNAPGRPILYGITEEFMNYFGLTSLADLPDLENS
jgi:segregation and condensation protein B